MSMKRCFRTFPVGKRKLDAGIDVAVGRDVAAGVAGAAGKVFQFVLVGGAGDRAEFVDIADQRRIAEDLPQVLWSTPRLRTERSPSIIGVMVGSSVHSTPSSAASARTPG